MNENIKQLFAWLMSKIGYVPKDCEERLRGGLQRLDDLAHKNYLDIAAGKITNLACSEATCDIISDSKATDPIKELCNTLEDEKENIVYGALTSGEFFTVPYYDENGNLRLMMRSGNYALVTKRDGHVPSEVYIILEDYREKHRTYYLLRHHRLERGTLSIDYSVMTKSGLSGYIPPKWTDIADSSVTYSGVTSIGLGYYRSPAKGRGLQTEKGQPLDFGCKEIIGELQMLDKLEHIEYKDGGNILFVHPSIAQRAEKDKKGQTRYKLTENCYVVEFKPGLDTKMIEQYSPEVRFDIFYKRRQELYSELEAQMHLSAGIFRDNTVTQGATATEVKRSNKDTEAFINNVHKMLDKGDVMTLEACGMYLGIRRELWEYSSDYYDPFADPKEQWDILIQAYENGGADEEDLIKWREPSLDDEAVKEKAQKIRQSRSGKSTVENLLTM